MIVTQVLQNGIGGLFSSVQNAATNVMSRGFSLLKHLWSSLTGHVDALIAQIRTWIEANKIAAIAIGAVSVITVPIVMPVIWAPLKAASSVLGTVFAAAIKVPAALAKKVVRWISARITTS